MNKLNRSPKSLPEAPESEIANLLLFWLTFFVFFAISGFREEHQGGLLSVRNLFYEQFSFNLSDGIR